MRHALFGFFMRGNKDNLEGMVTPFPLEIFYRDLYNNLLTYFIVICSFHWLLSILIA